MATKYFINGGVNNNYTDNTNWSTTPGGANDTTAPTSSDDVRLDGSSPNCVLNASGNALTFVCTGYTNTLSGSAGLSVAGNVTFVSGMTITATGTLTITATATLTSGGKTWTGNLTTSTSSNTTFTLADAWVIDGSFTFGNSANTHTFNGFTLSVKTNLTISGSSTASGSDGTTEFIMTGTGNIVHSGSTAIRKLQNPFRINTAGTITFDTNTLTFGGDFVYVAGTVTTTSSLVYFNNASGTKTLTTNGITFNNVTFGNTSGNTYTLSNVMDITGTLVFGTANSNTYTLNGSSISVKGNITITITNGTIAGTTVLNINGTGSQTWSGTSSTPIRLDTNINKSSGTLTLGTNIAYNTGTLTYTAGTVDTTTNSSTLTIAASTTLNTSGITWNNITFSVAVTITINSLLSANGTMTLPNAAITFAGTHGFSVATLTHTAITAARTYTLKAGITYTVTTSLNLVSLSATSRISLVSSIASSYAIFTLNSGASCNVKWVTATDIDSSAGRQVTNTKGTLTRTLNWYANNPDLFAFF